ncbi:DUF262 domain-containing protein [Micromonospora sp. WMMD708]|uniref:DUF262 domain-containing protein n=1 Tax=Micromonospora sp. WMMD708 TaxID=3403464 RepID=UPI003BF48907
MSAGLDTRPKATTLDLEELTQLAWTGRIRVPHFQRPLRWQRSDVMRLFESIVLGYPVGSFLLWRRPAAAETLQLGALRIAAPETGDALWVVDGQQRIISLANALHPDGMADPRFALAYDLRNEQFVPLPQVEEPAIVPLPVLFDLTRVLRWFTSHPEAAQFVEQANEVTRTLRQFRIPAYEVVQDDPRVLQDIFDRMNNFGKRLSRAEIFSGLFPGEEAAKDTTSTLDRIAQNIDDELGFGLIDNDTVLQAVLARRGPDVKREIRNEFGAEQKISPSHRAHQPNRATIDFPDEDRDTAYALGEEAMRRAVAFLQNEAGVPHFSMLPYSYLIVVLTRFFAHHPDPGQRVCLLLKRWFWRAALVGPGVFRGSTTGAIRFLNYAVQPDNLNATIAELHRWVEHPNAPLPNLQRFRSNEAATKIILCSWWSLAPRSLSTADPFVREDLSLCLQDRPTALDATRYVVSRYSVPPPFRLWAADRVLLPTVEGEVGVVDTLLTRQPAGLSEILWRDVLASHCLDAEIISMIRRGDVQAFLLARQEKLGKQLADFLARSCEWSFENTPPLADLVVEDEELTEEKESNALF